MTRVGRRFLRAMPVRVAGGLLIAMGALLALASESEADTLRVGRPSARGFAGVPLVTGVKHGSFRAQGLELELAVFGGGRTSQAMTAGSGNISVQSGTEMAFLASLAVRPRESGDPGATHSGPQSLDSRLRGNERSLWLGRRRRTQR
jgi:ABC-type nitrate/sulfonate/bicarbonate transport system substrate-binding protein